MISKEIARDFADEWEKSWNSHDIDRIMGHYANNIVLVSPVAGRLLGRSEVRGIDSVKSYFIAGLQACPNLRFEVLDVFRGEDSIVLYYVNQDGVKAGEFMQFDSDGKVCRMYAHYD